MSMQQLATKFAVLLGLGFMTTASTIRANDSAPQPTAVTAFIGTSTGGTSEGIYTCQLDLATGELSDLKLAARTANPGFLAVAPDGRFLYAVGRGGSGGGDFIAAFAIDRETHQLTLLNELPIRGAGACHISLDRDARHALVANYGSGSAEVFRIADDGRLVERTAFVQHSGSSVNPARQTGPHAHAVHLDPAGRFALVADLGLDQLLVYRFDDGALQPAATPYAQVEPGAGPRHFDFHPNGRFCYLLNELNLTVAVFAYDADTGQLDHQQTISTLPASVDASDQFAAAELLVHPSGRFVYASNRGHNSVAALAVDKRTGHLRLIETEPTGGDWPRNFGIDPTGQFLVVANRRSGELFVMRIDSDSGKLERLPRRLELDEPMCVRFLQP